MIVIDSIQSIGPWGVSKGLHSPLKTQLFSDNIQDLPWQYPQKSLEEQLLLNSPEGIIKDNVLESLSKNLILKNLSRETKLAIYLAEHFSDLNLSDGKSSLVCASLTAEEPNDPKSPTDINSYLQDLPNQLMANLAIYFNLEEESINFCGPNSSFNALQSALRNISSGFDDEILFVASFCYRIAMIGREFTSIIQSAADASMLNQIPFNEWIGVTRIKKVDSVEPSHFILLALNYIRLDIQANLESQVFDAIDKLISSANKSLKEIDLLLVNDPFKCWLLDKIKLLNFFQPDIQIVDFYERLGYSANCSFAQSLELAQMIFDHNALPRKIDSDFRQNNEAFNAINNTKFKGQCCLIICSNTLGELQMGLLDRPLNEI